MKGGSGWRYPDQLGLGWKVLAGAITPIWSGSKIAYYLYVDSTGPNIAWIKTKAAPCGPR